MRISPITAYECEPFVLRRRDLSSALIETDSQWHEHEFVAKTPSNRDPEADLITTVLSTDIACLRAFSTQSSVTR